MTNKAWNIFSVDFPDIHFDIVSDLCQLITLTSFYSHKLRRSANNLYTDTPTTHLQDPDTTLYFRLRRVFKQIYDNNIIRNLSYYNNIIELIKESSSLDGNFLTYKITFDHSANLNLLFTIWSINVKGYNISITSTHLTDQQIAYCKTNVIRFKGFSQHITESQTL